jgi:hypothetical protein
MLTEGGIHNKAPAPTVLEEVASETAVWKLPG